VKKRYLRQPLVKFLQQLNDYSENDLILKFVDDFLVSRYTSLTTKSSLFVWSTISRNLNQLKFSRNPKIFEKLSYVIALKSFDLALKRYWKSMENGFCKCVGTLVSVLSFLICI